MVSVGLLLSIALGLISALFLILVGLLAWLGVRLFAKLDELSAAWHKLVLEIHERIQKNESRIEILERLQEETIPHRRAGDN